MPTKQQHHPSTAISMVLSYGHYNAVGTKQPQAAPAHHHNDTNTAQHNIAAITTLQHMRQLKL